MEGLENCLSNNNSRLANIHLLQTNGAAKWSPKLAFLFQYSN